MQALDNQLLSNLNVFAGLEALEKDIELLEAFQQNALGCGLESLDHPTGQLVTSGLAARYPQHYQVSEGMEGISNLVNTLKTAVSKLKGAFKGKKPDQIVSKPTNDALAALNTQYGKNFWLDYTPQEKETVKPVGLLTLVKGGSFSDVKSQVETYLTACETELKSGVANLLKFWAGIEPKFNALKTAATEEERQQLLNDIIEYGETNSTNDLIADDLPAHDSGGTLAPLSADDAKAAVEFVKALVTRSKDIYAITDPMWDVGITDDDADGYFDHVEDKRDRSVRYLRDSMATMLITEDIVWYTEATREYMLKVAVGIEAWVDASTK